jgi:ATP-dependent HslUV protease ATP-binding subunit HslU
MKFESPEEHFENPVQPEEDAIPDEGSLTPDKIVAELNQYIIGQDKAKRSVAIALRNRWRRLKIKGAMREEITPKNIIMIGPTGVGKTEISRRLAKLAKAPFVKVEASKFTEVGYVGRDVESIVRDLAEVSHNLVREEERARVLDSAQEMAEEQILDLLLPGSSKAALKKEQDYSCSDFTEQEDLNGSRVIYQDSTGVGHVAESESQLKTRDKLQKLLKEGKLEERVIEVELYKQPATQMQILGPQGFGEIEGQIKDLFSNMVPRQKEVKKLSVKEARKVLIQEAQENLIDHDKVTRLALKRAEQTGIIFIDEIDKICGATSNKGPDVSREGVQRDLLPLVEGSTVSTKYGPLKTDHVLFIASGAFHTAKPSDLMPEFQGRFPIRVELSSLTSEDFERILKEPQNALTKQYIELLKTENVTIEFADSAISTLAEFTAEVNSRTENIGARRLHTLLEKLLEELSFEAHKHSGTSLVIDKEYVNKHLAEIVKDRDLSRFIL